MQRTLWITIYTVVLTLTLSACGSTAMSPSDGTSVENGERGTTTPVASGDPGLSQQGQDNDDVAAPVNGGAVDAVLQRMTVEQKVGQLINVNVAGNSAHQPNPASRGENAALHGVETPAEVVERFHVGGVTYFGDRGIPGTSNVADLSMTAQLSRDLQHVAAADTGVGLLIATDQEGGDVVRLESPAVTFPSARAIAETGDRQLGERVGQTTAGQALAVGVNWVFSPVGDVNVNPNNPVIGRRAFGITAQEALPWIETTARGLISGGVAATIKHFPGHGDTNIDSHTSLPKIDHDRETLFSVDLPSFSIASALDPETQPITVMVGHLAVPALDSSGRPATLSEPMVTGVLRGELGFDGVVVTDAMDMGALSGFGTQGELAVEAVLAGIDVVLMPTDVAAVYSALLSAVNDGTITQERLDESVTRILRLKAQLGILDANAASLQTDPSRLGNADAQAVREEVGRYCNC